MCCRTNIANTDKLRITRIIGLLLITAAAGACSGAPQTAPSPPGATIPSSSPGSVPTTPRSGSGSVTEIAGFVLDTAFHSLNGATITVLDGPSAGASAHSVDGQIYLEGAFEPARRSGLRPRATSPRWERGIAASPVPVRRRRRRPGSDSTWRRSNPPSILRASTRSRLSRTVRAPICRRRSGRATTRPRLGRRHPMELHSARRSRVPRSSGTCVRSTLVSGADATFLLDGGEERPSSSNWMPLPTSRSAARRRRPSMTREIPMPLDGWIEYCVTKTPMSGGYFCNSPEASRRSLQLREQACDV